MRHSAYENLPCTSVHYEIHGIYILFGNIVVPVSGGTVMKRHIDPLNKYVP